MRSLKRRAIPMVLALLLLLPGTGVFAATFSDVPKDHWAYDYIYDLSEEGVINGYPQGKYYPNREVAYLEVLKLFRGMLNPGKEETEQANREFGSLVRIAGVPDWAQESVAFALKRNIITEITLESAKNKGLLVDNAKRVPDRNTIAVYLARALEMTPSDDFSVLQYEDLDKIDEQVKTYLVPLVKAGIFSPTGSDGNFEGNRGIRRSEMAKIIAESREEAKKVQIAVPLLPSEKDPYEEPESKIPDEEKDLKTLGEEFMENQAKESYGSNYQILGQTLKDVEEIEEDGKNGLIFSYTLTVKRFDRDPDEVPYIKRAKETGDPDYEYLKQSYLDEKKSSAELKLLENNRNDFTLFENIGSEDAKVWKQTDFKSAIQII